MLLDFSGYLLLDKMKRYLLVHYGEIGLKKSNTPYFLRKLRKALKMRLEKAFGDNFRINHTLQRFMITLPDEIEEAACVEVIKKISGIHHFKFVLEGSTDLKKLAGSIWEGMPEWVTNEETRPQTFRVKCKRSMTLPYKSIEAEREIAGHLYQSGIDIKAKMKDPEFVVDVEFFNGHGYFSYKKHKGAAGMPPNSESKLVCLMSSGFDSPVAAYKMMRRGARVIFVHFHGYPYTDVGEMDQVKDLVEVLSGYQFDTKLYLLPLGKVQKEIATNLDIPGKIRTILYRRMMLRIAEQIAKKEHARGVVTGDSYGQVASQTPENLFAVHDVSTIPLFQPLISFDKEDIIAVAREIGTEKISALPCKDSCTMFASRKPEIKANVHDLNRYEENLPIDDWIARVLAEAEVIGPDEFK
jgi:tRNA uracil 4-sulfurtransferase